MTVSISALKALVASGATAEMVVAMIEADRAATHEQRTDRREKNAARMRGVRAHKRAQMNTDAHKAGGTQGAVGELQGATQDVVVTLRADAPSAGAAITQKERSPTPPKEIIPTKEEEAFKLKVEEEGSSSENMRARAKPACRLPQDWGPTLDDLVFARTLLPFGREALEVEKFRDYWHARAGPRSVSKNWSANWRNWCRKSVEMSEGGGNGTYQQNRGGNSPGRGEGFAAFAKRRATAE